MTDSSKDDFKIEKVLGKGSFGSVYLVRRKEDNKIYALKSVTLEKLNKKEQQNSVNEVRILASVNHPNVIGYKEAFWDDKDSTLNIVMEYADDGDLQTKIVKMRKEGGMFKEDLIWSYSIQMIEGLKALHDKKIMHRDLKSANIFLVKDKHQCKLGDMNVSKVIKEKDLLTQTGTPYYASPEVWRDEPYSYKSDLWSIGCVIYELCALRPPFRGKDLDELFVNVCKGKVDRISHVYSDDLWKMILMLLQVDVKKRCNCDKFLNSKLITRKIQEMKNQDKDYKYLEKNKDISDGHLLDTIKFDNILDIKRQLPTTKNYNNSIEYDNSTKNTNKKVNKKKNINLNIDTTDNKGKNKKINLIDNSIKYHKINNYKNKIINYNTKNNENIVKNNNIVKSEKPKESELEEKQLDIEKNENGNEKIKDNEMEKDKEKEEEKEIVNNSNKINDNNTDAVSEPLEKLSQPSLPIQESQNSLQGLKNNENANSSSKKNIPKNKYIRKSPNKKKADKEQRIVYQKPKLAENTVKREKKIIPINASSTRPMTTKRTAKKINYIERNISPKKTSNKLANKTENISSMNDKKLHSLRNKNIYKSGYTSIHREKNPKNIPRPIETSPSANYKHFYSNINNINYHIPGNAIKKKSLNKNLKNDPTQRPQSATPSKKNIKLNNNLGNNLEQNQTEINMNMENDPNNCNKIGDNSKEYTNNREKMINMLINNYNKINININNFNNQKNNYSNNRMGNKIYTERPISTTNNQYKSQKNYSNRYPVMNKIQMNNPKKLNVKPSSKLQLRDKENFSKKIINDKNMYEREMTEPELLKMRYPININSSKRDYQRNFNISLNNQENNTFLHQPKYNKMERYYTNNNPRYNQYYSSGVNKPEQQSHAIMNNLGLPHYPVKLLNAFQK